MFQNEVAMVATNQAYGAGTMIGQWPAQILASCPEPKENYITATINLEQVRKARTEQPESPAEKTRALRGDREADGRTPPAKQMMFAKHIGIDYSGRGTPLSRLPGLQVYAATGDRLPQRVNPPSAPQGKDRNWCRKEVAEWLLQQVEGGQPFIGPCIPKVIRTLPSANSAGLVAPEPQRRPPTPPNRIPHQLEGRGFPWPNVSARSLTN